LGCIQSASFAVLINGSPSKNFFGASRGLRKGCPISLFLFLLIIKVLRKIMTHARSQGELKVLKISPSEVLSHLLFIDDVLLFGAGSREEFQGLRCILDLFFLAIGMDINWTKSYVHYSFPKEYLTSLLDSALPFPRKHMSEGFKYLGFF
jgi:hypothetical protein